VLWGLTRYHWLVLAAVWFGWGFDIYDALLFNFVAPNAVPVLLGLSPGTPEAREAVVFWTGILTSLLLVGWAVGGLLFGWVADRIGRRRALFLTITVYACGTALCAAATDIWQLTIFRAIASLGIGGEWAAGAVLLAESVPEHRRLDAATLMQTASPLGIVLASFVNYQVAGVWFADSPEYSWRVVFLCGLLPVALAIVVRLFIRESDQWERRAGATQIASPRELLSPAVRRFAASGLFVSVAAILTWWGCNAFVPLLGSTLAGEHAAAAGLTPSDARALAEAWKSQAANAFNYGGLAGTFAVIPLAKLLTRRHLYIAYFLFSSAAIAATFGLDLPPEARIRLLFAVGFGVYGIFGTHVFYLPELFPARLRATGAGTCYNLGRIVAALGPFVVGAISAAAGGSSAVILQTLLWVAVVPLVAAALTPLLVIETRGRALPP
jgi:MFS family permease